MEEHQFYTIEEVIADLKKGKPIILVDNKDRENEGDVVIAAEFADAAAINFMATHARGLICIAMTPERLDALGLPLMVSNGKNQSQFQSPFTISVDAAKGITTGISAADRAQTIRTLIAKKSTGRDLVAPGHLFPLRAHPSGLTARQGHTEASVDLMQRAGLHPAAVICEIMDTDGSMARLPRLQSFASEHNLKIASIDQLMEYRRPEIIRQEFSVSETAQLPTPVGNSQISAYMDDAGQEHLLLRYGNPGPVPLVRIHSECLTGDVFGSRRCDCGEQLKEAQKLIAMRGGGIIIYLRQEGRGIGLYNKINAYALQEQGLDTIEANLHLGFAADERSFKIAATILKDHGIRMVRLMTNNPQKIRDLEDNGIRVVQRIPLQIKAREENRHYIQTKALKMNHLISEELL